MPIAEATVSVMDRGFLFGDGVYEVIPVYSQRAFRLPEHLQRLQNSLDAIRLINPKTNLEWSQLIAEMIALNKGDDQSVYLQITRGADSKRNHAFPEHVFPTVFMMSEPLVTPSAALRESGVAAVTAMDNRWLRCDIKSTSLLANCLLRQQAVDAGCVETILLREGQLSEGAASNIFVVKNGVLLAPQKNNFVLPGITYDVVLELAEQHGLTVEVRTISEEELRTADEVWMTSSTKEVLAITLLDGQPVGAEPYRGRPGPVGAQMYTWYQNFKTEVMRSDA